MSVSAGIARLNDAMKTLDRRFLDVEREWDDVVRADFERRRLDPVREQVKATLREMERLADVLAKARRECS
jgi:hypothetical protein